MLVFSRQFGESFTINHAGESARITIERKKQGRGGVRIICDAERSWKFSRDKQGRKHEQKPKAN